MALLALTLISACTTGQSHTVLPGDPPVLQSVEPLAAQPVEPLPQRSPQAPVERIDHSDVCPLEVSWLRRPERACLTHTGDRIWAPRVVFQFDKGTIRPISFPGLDSVAALLRRHPHLRLRIEGHKDDRGHDHY